MGAIETNTIINNHNHIVSPFRTQKRRYDGDDEDVSLPTKQMVIVIGPMRSIASQFPLWLLCLCCVWCYVTSLSSGGGELLECQRFFVLRAKKFLPKIEINFQMNGRWIHFVFFLCCCSHWTVMLITLLSFSNSKGRFLLVKIFSRFISNRKNIQRKYQWRWFCCCFSLVSRTVHFLMLSLISSIIIIIVMVIVYYYLHHYHCLLSNE